MGRKKQKSNSLYIKCRKAGKSVKEAYRIVKAMFPDFTMEKSDLEKEKWEFASELFKNLMKNTAALANEIIPERNLIELDKSKIIKLLDLDMTKLIISFEIKLTLQGNYKDDIAPSSEIIKVPIDLNNLEKLKTLGLY
ncbi:MAG: hypothetical protein HWN67_18770 [Candidatus Helarchaeota archaeon]|nr:hypothetical protein [Candidatus Helarchaeota archaeon]